MKILILLTAMILAPFEKVTYGQPCKKWDEAEAAGALDHKFIHEASGIAASRINKNRLYHVNDSGNGPYFYTTDEYGSDTKQIMIKDFNFKRADFEDMTIGPCYAKTCVFIADIGDNRRSRDFINILIIEEKEKYGQSEKPLRIVKLEYPDKPHNAESLAIHPNGDLYIITKEENYKRQKSFPSHIFRVKREKWEYAASKPLRLDHIGILDIESINPDTSGFFDNLITSFDISEDGKKFVVLTYQNAYEFNIDLSKSNSNTFAALQKGLDYSVVILKRLPQQESISYLPDSKSLLYNTEYKAITPKLMRVDCLD